MGTLDPDGEDVGTHSLGTGSSVLSHVIEARRRFLEKMGGEQSVILPFSWEIALSLMNFTLLVEEMTLEQRPGQSVLSREGEEGWKIDHGRERPVRTSETGVSQIVLCDVNYFRFGGTCVSLSPPFVLSIFKELDWFYGLDSADLCCKDL